MELSEYISAIKLELTGGVLELEISDDVIGKTVIQAMHEIQRYTDETRLIQVPYVPCIDISGFKCSSITQIYRTEVVGDSSIKDSGMQIDPMWAQTWMAFSNGSTMYNLNNFMLNYASWATLSQIRNTLSTDLSFKVDHQANKLYINYSAGKPTNIAIEYVLIYEDVHDVKSDYWIDILQRLSLAMVKRILGRIRTRFTQTNALWAQDGETMLTEGNNEITALREVLRTNSSLSYPVD